MKREIIRVESLSTWLERWKALGAGKTWNAFPFNVVRQNIGHRGRVELARDQRSTSQCDGYCRKRKSQRCHGFRPLLSARSCSHGWHSLNIRPAPSLRLCEGFDKTPQIAKRPHIPNVNAVWYSRPARNRCSTEPLAMLRHRTGEKQGDLQGFREFYGASYRIERRRLRHPSSLRRRLAIARGSISATYKKQRERCNSADASTLEGRSGPEKRQPARNTDRGMEYFPPQLEPFRSPVLPRLKHPFYFKTVV
jgi:hypothetical protein